MVTENLQLYRKTFEVAKEMLKRQKDISRSVRYGVYGDAVKMIFNAMDLIYVANSNKDDRVDALSKYIQTLGGIRSRIRLLGEEKYLSKRTQDYIACSIAVCLKQAIGWRNTTLRESSQGIN